MRVIDTEYTIQERHVCEDCLSGVGLAGTFAVPLRTGGAGELLRGDPGVDEPFAASGPGTLALSRRMVLMGNFVRHVEHTGTGEQKTATKRQAGDRRDTGKAHWTGRRSRRSRRR